MATRLTIRLGDHTWTAAVSAASVTFTPDGRTVAIVPTSDGALTATGNNSRWNGATARDGGHVWVGLGARVFVFDVDDGRAGGRGSAHDPHALTPPMPATVLRVNVAPGTTVAAGDPLLVLEAMKMEIAIRAPRAGMIRSVRCQAGDLVQPGTVLVEYDEP